MWQRETRTGHSKTPDYLRYNAARGYENPDVNMRTFSQRRDVEEQHVKGENLRDFTTRNMSQNTSSSDRMIGHGPSPHSSTSFSRDSNKRNSYSVSSASHMTPDGSQYSMSTFSGLGNNVPIPNMGNQSMSRQNMDPPNMGLPNITQHSMTLPHMAQQNMGTPNITQHSVRLPNMVQQNMGPPNTTHQNMGPPNMSQQNALQNLPLEFMNGLPISLPPPGFNSMNIPPPGYNDNRIPNNIPPPPVPGQYGGLPPPDNRLMAGNNPSPINIDNSQHNTIGLTHFPPSMLNNQGFIPVPMHLHQMNNQQTFSQEGKRLAQNEDSETRILDQALVNKFIEERQLKPVKKENGKPKVGEAKEMLQKWFQVLNKVEAQHNKLTECMKSGDSEWQRELQKTNLLKEELDQVEAEFSSQFDMDSLLKDIKKKQRKREWQKRRRKTLALRKKENESKKFELHLKIDQWREKEIAKAQAKFKDAKVKKEAGGVLGDVRRKQSDSSKALSLLQAVRKLRSFRKQEAEVKGVYQKPTPEQSKEFEGRLDFMEKLMKRHHEIYDSEEKTLVVMIAEEEEEKERERREKKLAKQLAEAVASDSSDPMREFYRYYTQAENGLDSLLHIRHGWDMYIVPEVVAGGSCVPQGEVSSASPNSKTWATFLQEIEKNS